MPITTRDRKLLWGRAGGVCTLCKSRLTEDAKGGDRDVVLGEEAHIVSEEPNGPRYHPMPKEEVDTYANLMLLCPSDHKIVDEQVTYYTEQRLQTLKREHEQWVTYRFSPAPPPISVRDPEAGKPLALQHIDAGKELMNIASHKHAIHHDSPELQSIEKAELMGAFLQSVTDYNDIGDDIGPNRRIQAEFSMTEELLGCVKLAWSCMLRRETIFLRAVPEHHLPGQLLTSLFTEVMMKLLKTALRISK